jgi:hypothetical protein
LISKKGYSYKGHTIVEYGLSTQFEFNKENEWDYFEALNNLDALSDMTDEVERTYFEQDKAYMHHIGELPSYSGMNYAIAEQDRIFEYEQDDADDSVEGVVLEEADDSSSENIDYYKTYSGMITELEPNQIFVFGSNTQGRHGKGAALMARYKFGAVYG